MSTESGDRATFRSIWEQHRPQTFARIDALDRAAALAAEGRLSAEERDQARREAHTLAGSVAFFGFLEGSRIAAELEEFFLSTSAPDPEWLRERLAKLRGALEGLPYTF